jgi:CspA family cold shock protein
MEGKVKWFNARKGYGFITGDDGTEYFVHYSGLDGGKFVRENDRVSFEPADTEKGKQAQKVKLLQKGSEISGGSQSESSEDAQEE